jgi:hypothetical protein
MGRAYSMQWRVDKFIQYFGKEKCSEYLWVDGRIILKFMLFKWGENFELVASRSG